jgi:hypothetical protein
MSEATDKRMILAAIEEECWQAMVDLRKEVATRLTSDRSELLQQIGKSKSEWQDDAVTHVMRRLRERLVSSQ